MGADKELRMSYRETVLFCRVQLILHIAGVIAHKKRIRKTTDENVEG